MPQSAQRISTLHEFWSSEAFANVVPEPHKQPWQVRHEFKQGEIKGGGGGAYLTSGQVRLHHGSCSLKSGIQTKTQIKLTDV